MIDVVLKSKRKIKVRELTLDQVADLNDIPEVTFNNGVVSTIKNLNKAKLAWLRCGIGGGDFEGWEPNGAAPPDNVIKQLSPLEQDELVEKIKLAQDLSKKK
tara:strand:- start:505 stop:810 length:306 start_codon:yes stop_codon:yes gene_type:complete